MVCKLEIAEFYGDLSFEKNRFSNVHKNLLFFSVIIS